jgi:hypothetical protein
MDQKPIELNQDGFGCVLKYWLWVTKLNSVLWYSLWPLVNQCNEYDNHVDNDSVLNNVADGHAELAIWK